MQVQRTIFHGMSRPVEKAVSNVVDKRFHATTALRGHGTPLDEHISVTTGRVGVHVCLNDSCESHKCNKGHTKAFEGLWATV